MQIPMWQGIQNEGQEGIKNYIYIYILKKLYIYIKKLPRVAFLRRYSLNEKCGSKQTNFEHTWLSNKKFTILN